MKKIKLLVLLVMVASLFIACLSSPSMSEGNRLFMQETQLSLAVPMRFYTWVNVENSNRVMSDIMDGILNFEYDSSGNFLLRTYTQDDKIVSVWGNQILLKTPNLRTLIFSPFVPAIYALENGKDPLDIAFEALRQMLEGGYSHYEESLLPVFQDGIKLYRLGGDAWQNFKAEHFLVADKTIIIR
ncbi:MAG: hypothetical protein FWD14_04555 [Treponema sp.]|nr:hypothetical protein [Treponema sp.]